MKLDFNRGWTFRKENGEGRTVDLPLAAVPRESLYRISALVMTRDWLVIKAILI